MEAGAGEKAGAESLTPEAARHVAYKCSASSPLSQVDICPI